MTKQKSPQEPRPSSWQSLLDKRGPQPLKNPTKIMRHFLVSCIREFGQGHKTKEVGDTLFLFNSLSGDLFVVDVRLATDAEAESLTTGDFLDPSQKTFLRAKVEHL